MNAVQLRDEVRADMIAHARDEAPNECCGLLVGAGSLIDECVRVRNLRASPTRYLLDPAEHIATNRRLRGSRRAVIGCYHSHPHTSPVPSDTDRAEALYEEFVWVIVSLAGSGSGEVAAYRLEHETFVALAIVPIP
jgi:desampylase